jgi:hypothetical protein
MAKEDDEEKEKRTAMIQEEFDKIVVQDTQAYVEEVLEDDLEPEAVEALRTAAHKLAYTMKYYDVMKDELIWFPSVPKLIMTNALQMEAELHYWEEEDEFPSEYAKALKTVVREKGHLKEGDEDAENDAYMEKLAQDVEV